MDAVCERAQSREIPVVVHCVAESQLTALWRLSKVGVDPPPSPLLALCAFSGSSQAQHTLEVAAERDNVYFETSLMATVPALIDELARWPGPTGFCSGRICTRIQSRSTTAPSHFSRFWHRHSQRRTSPGSSVGTPRAVPMRA